MGNYLKNAVWVFFEKNHYFVSNCEDEVNLGA